MALNHDQKDQFPFPLHVLEASQEKIAKPEPRYDLAEHRFDDHLPPSVFFSSFLRVVAPGHSLLGSMVIGQPTFRRFRTLISESRRAQNSAIRRNLGISSLSYPDKLLIAFRPEPSPAQ